MKPQSSDDISGWASRLLQLGKGYKVTSRSATFGSLTHMVKTSDISFNLNQGRSRALISEVDATGPVAQEMINDLITVGAIFPVAEASTWSLLP
jgi:hypothetical protein